MKIDIASLFKLFQDAGNRERMTKTLLCLELHANLRLLETIDLETTIEPEDRVRVYASFAKLLTIDATEDVLAASGQKIGFFMHKLNFVTDEVEPARGRSEEREVLDALKSICISIRTLAKLDAIDPSIRIAVRPRQRLQNLKHNILALLTTIEGWESQTADHPKKPQLQN